MHIRLFSLCVPFLLLIYTPNVQAQLPIEGTVIQLVAGSGSGIGSFRGDGGDATIARLNNPQDVVYHPDGYILIADMSNHRIRKVDLTTGIISTFAGNSSSTASGNVGLATDAGLPFPRSLAVDVFGTVYVATLNQIRFIDENGFIDLWAGTTARGNSDGGRHALESSFGTIGGMAFDLDNGLIFCDTDNNKVRKVRTNSTVITIAGNGSTGSTNNIGDNGSPLFANLNGPVDVEIDPTGVIYIAERLGNRIRRIKNNVITTIYSRANDPGFVPRGLAVFDDLFLYFSNDNHKIQRINLFNNEVELLAGTGNPEFSGEGGRAYLAEIDTPIGMNVDPDGNLYFVEQGNNTVRFVTIPGGDVEPTPRPTSTPTPSPTVTPTPTRTPTSTPRIVQQTATPTPFLTATPTATPSALPRGQLSPANPSLPSNGTNFLFYGPRTTEVIVPEEVTSNKVKVVLSSTVAGNGPFTVSDKISLLITRPDNTTSTRDIVFSDSTPMAPLDITTLFKKGTNKVTVTLFDTKGSGNSSSALFVVVFSAPMIRDIPDIRGLTNQRLTNVYRIDDFISDRDTPIADATVTISTTNPRLVIDSSGPGRMINLEPVNRPGNATFSIRVSDGIFEASEVINVKHSSFLFDRFQLDPAPLLEDFAFISSTNFDTLVRPFGYNLSLVPFETKFTTGTGIKAAHVAHGQTYIFPDFAAESFKAPVKSPVDISLIGQRLTNPNENLDDYDGMIVTTSSVITPGGGRADRNYNFTTATSFLQTNWQVQGLAGTPMGTASIRTIPQDPVPEITDGYGAILEVDPGETIILRSDFIDIPPGPVLLSMWFAVENIGIDDSDVPAIRLALLEDSNNYSLSYIQRSEIKGKSEYQFLSTTYDVIDSEISAAIFIEGTQRSGTVQVYVDNIRVFPMKRDIDRSLGLTNIRVEFDGSFESVLRGLGDFINISFTNGAQAVINQDVNRTITPTGLRKSLNLALNEPDSGVQIVVGPSFIDSSIYSFPRAISARAYVNRLTPGNEGGVFAIGVTNGDHLAVTSRSNKDISSDRDTWIPVTATGYFNVPGEPPLIFIQNVNGEGSIPGVIPDGASIAVDDISLETVNDSMNYWDQKRLPKIR